MRPYFQEMTKFGTDLKEGQIKSTEENLKQIKAVEADIDAAVEKVKNVGFPTEKINARGQLTVWQRLEYLVDPGTWCPLHTLYNPAHNEEGTTNVFDGLGKISGKWAVIIGFDNKVMAGAWLPGQSENILRVTDLAKRLNIPLVWLVNCSGVKLTEQEKFYANRRGAGTTFFRHAELEQMGIPILAGIYGTNPAGGGLSGHQPDHSFRPQGLQHRRGRRRHRERHVAQGALRPGRGRADSSKPPSSSRPSPPGRSRSTTTRPDFSAMSTKRGGGSGWPEGLHEGHAGLPPQVLPGGPAQATALPGRDIYRLLPIQPEADVQLRRDPGPPGGRQRAHGIPPRLRPGGLHRAVQDRRFPGGRHRQPPGLPGQGISRICRLPRASAASSTARG